MKIQHKHVKRQLSKVRHKGFEVIPHPSRTGTVIAFEGGKQSYVDNGGAALVYRNPVSLLKTVREHF